MTKWEKGVEPFYNRQSDSSVLEKIEVLKNELKSDVVILGHHYQHNDIVRFADYTGDSLVLSQKAAAADKKHIVFCGVEFMAECAHILARDDQHVHLPRKDAGCSMADMATVQQLTEVWQELSRQIRDVIIPITYINSSADIKAFVGEHGGIVCTSANAPKIFEWALNQGQRILFLPDQFLGKNTALAYGFKESDMTVVSPGFSASVKDKKVFLWDGYCSVHRLFDLAYIKSLRTEYPEIKIIVHGECTAEVVKEADNYGSTSVIIREVSNSAPGTVWGVGTEEHLVNRLRERFQDKTILSLSDGGYQCATMSLIRPEDLLCVLQEIKADKYRHILKVPQDIKQNTALALSRMLEIS